MRVHALLLTGSLLGFTAIAFGAYAEHGLRPTLDAASYHSLSTALHYHLLHALLITAIGLATITLPLKRLRAAGWLAVLGTLLFSGGIYLSTLTGDATYKSAAPLGGSLLMLAWLTTALSAIALPRLIKSRG